MINHENRLLENNVLADEFDDDNDDDDVEPPITDRPFFFGGLFAAAVSLVIPAAVVAVGAEFVVTFVCAFVAVNFLKSNGAWNGPLCRFVATRWSFKIFNDSK